MDMAAWGRSRDAAAPGGALAESSVADHRGLHVRRRGERSPCQTRDPSLAGLHAAAGPSTASASRRDGARSQAGFRYPPPMETRAGDQREAFAAGVLQLEAVLELFAQEAASSLGRRALRELQPRSHDAAREALQRVRATHSLLQRGAEPPLAGLTDLEPAFARGLRGFDEEQLAGLRALIEARGRILAWGAEHGEEAAILLAVLERAPDLTELHARLERALDGRGRLKVDASALHERLSREVQEQSSRIERHLKDILARADVRAVLSDSSVHRRQGRPVLAVKARLSGRVRGLVHDEPHGQVHCLAGMHQPLIAFVSSCLSLDSQVKAWCARRVIAIDKALDDHGTVVHLPSSVLQSMSSPTTTLALAYWCCGGRHCHCPPAQPCFASQCLALEEGEPRVFYRLGVDPIVVVPPLRRLCPA